VSWFINHSTKLLKQEIRLGKNPQSESAQKFFSWKT
jgi:hypothetical protein